MFNYGIMYLHKSEKHLQFESWSTMYSIYYYTEAYSLFPFYLDYHNYYHVHFTISLSLFTYLFFPLLLRSFYVSFFTPSLVLVYLLVLPLLLKLLLLLSSSQQYFDTSYLKLFLLKSRVFYKDCIHPTFPDPIFV